MGLVLLVALACWLALTRGAMALDAGEVWAALQGRGEPSVVAIVGALRAPRLGLALCSGAVLAVSGVTLQALLRNPLADPALIGVSAGGAVGAALALVVLPLLGLGTLIGAPAAAFLGSALTCAGLWRIGRAGGRPNVARILLAGVALNALAGAAVGLTLELADERGLRALTTWLLGSLAGATWPTARWSMALSGVAIVGMLSQWRALDGLLLGERGARQLGLSPEAALRRTVAWVALGVGASVAACGIVGFVGFVVPHALRQWLGPRHRALLPLSALGGAALLALADVVARIAMPPAELPVGVLTSLVGAPFFLALIVRSRSASLA